jgi:Holliday junction resolvase RusA-like endonuclease
MGRGGRYYCPNKDMQRAFILASRIQQTPPRVPWKGKIKLTLVFNFKIAKTRRDLKPGDYCDNNVDVDNLVKFVLDALQKVYFKNDRSIVSVYAVKLWAREPSTLVRLELLP